MEKVIWITGGAGFIGSHLVRHFVQRYPHYHIVNIDALTYAGNLLNLRDIEGAKNYSFEKADICDTKEITKLFKLYHPVAIIHLAAESHVDRSILSPGDFVRTNIEGTVNLLNVCRHFWEGKEDVLFYHVSTDEVYGSLGEDGYFTEETPYNPQSPYAASKAASDHFVRAYGNTYRLPYVISNCSNNYGPYQFPEKLIPLTIRNLHLRKPIPVYGRGQNVRDWLYVLDHCEAIDKIFHAGERFTTYNIGGRCEKRNLEVVELLCDLYDERMQTSKSRSLIRFVEDRAGHDYRYAIDCTKLEKTLGWRPQVPFEEGLGQTLEWYLTHWDWVEAVTSGTYREYYEKQYAHRL